MHHSVYKFFMDSVPLSQIEGKRVLEIGSYNVNGSLRPIIEGSMNPATYVGTDIREGPMVDIVMPAEDLDTICVDNSFDVIICTEMLEHAEQWRKAVTNIKRILVDGGFVLLTTRSVGFPLHDHPGDFWRFSETDMLQIFNDFEIERLASDPQLPGVFVKAIKPPSWSLEPHFWIDLSTIYPYDMNLHEELSWMREEDK